MAFGILVIIFRVPLAIMLGASGDTLINQTSDYIMGYIIGVPASVCALVLIAFLEFAGQSGLIVAATVGLTVSSVASDLLNVYLQLLRRFAHHLHLFFLEKKHLQILLASRWA